MSVYVDKRPHRVGRMVMCHMLADSMAELLTMADTIGVDRKWFQPQSHPHFDICKAKRTQAIKAGAIEVDRRTLVDAKRRYRRKWFADLDERAAVIAASQIGDRPCR
ncbi:DUF4031 domain-containing protein [uncultured Pelagimonas sp.]|uniref:DUF4031 domain-containing protein n=1 Tax=uncultured Pelagimonas sp. TaxID=1618102 RepID=UPI00262325E9|nr:DUF4031 domain-containing protein [uncultured Pelagimonas sp.]